MVQDGVQQGNARVVTHNVSRVVADALEQRRGRLNAKFAAARKSGTPIDAEAFLSHVASGIAPAIDAVAQLMPERAGVTLDELYDVSLELFAAGLLGSSAKYPAAVKVWTHVLAALPPQLVVRDPRHIAASLSNAAYHLAAAADARPEQCMSEMLSVAPTCTDVAQFLECGKIAAWRAGMAQYRRGALAAAGALTESLAKAALRLPAHVDVNRALQQMASDPWLDPASTLAPAVRQVRRLGGFRGFGGEFLRPPAVWTAAGHIFLADGEAVWQLVADLYGHVLVRHDSAPPPPLPQAAPAVPVKLTNDGSLRWIDGRSLSFPSLAGASGFAFDGSTLAITLPTSHHVFLIASTNSPDSPAGARHVA